MAVSMNIGPPPGFLRNLIGSAFAYRISLHVLPPLLDGGAAEPIGVGTRCDDVRLVGQPIEQRLAEEPLCRLSIALGRAQEVDGLAAAVHGSI